MGAILRRTRCGAAKRRRERRHRAYLKYARMSVVVALAEYKHHTSRCQRMDRVGGWERAALHGHVPEHPTPQAAGTEYFSLDVEDVSCRRVAALGFSPSLGRRSGSSGTLWSTLSTLCVFLPWCKFSVHQCRRWHPPLLSGALT